MMMLFIVIYDGRSFKDFVFYENLRTPFYLFALQHIYLEVLSQPLG